ncbi:hypothetical protein Clacol_003037 [Clathrus columnatus]|uniref:Uncharacterized protein n=1 Tax=Clathrus columnatus TaxID=1419009 RepID=A0AAV5A841_9AGAM|nr:hypothetical protein Clacol_003037 [Clathrus columnatus]
MDPIERKSTVLRSQDIHIVEIQSSDSGYLTTESPIVLNLHLETPVEAIASSHPQFDVVNCRRNLETGPPFGLYCTQRTNQGSPNWGILFIISALVISVVVTSTNAAPQPQVNSIVGEITSGAASVFNEATSVVGSAASVAASDVSTFLTAATSAVVSDASSIVGEASSIASSLLSSPTPLVTPAVDAGTASSPQSNAAGSLGGIVLGAWTVL